MPLPNYTTEVNVDRTIAEIVTLLRVHGARSIRTDYGANGEAVGLSFSLETPLGHVAFSLPIHVDKLLAVMERDHAKRLSRGRRPTREQAARVGWRIIRQWVAAQMAIVETEMVDLAEVFLPYLVTPGPHRRTLYEAMVEERRLLPPPTQE